MTKSRGRKIHKKSSWSGSSERGTPDDVAFRNRMARRDTPTHLTETEMSLGQALGVAAAHRGAVAAGQADEAQQIRNDIREVVEAQNDLNRADDKVRVGEEMVARGIHDIASVARYPYTADEEIDTFDRWGNRIRGASRKPAPNPAPINDIISRKLSPAEARRMMETERPEELKEGDETSKEITEWVTSTKPWRLEKPNGSLYHQLAQADENGKMFVPVIDQSVYLATNLIDMTRSPPQIFVMEHDWAGAFHNSDEHPDTIEMTFPKVAYEFQVNGRRVIVFLFHDGKGGDLCIAPVVKSKNGNWGIPTMATMPIDQPKNMRWHLQGDGGLSSADCAAFVNIFLENIMWSMVALQAEVAVVTPQRAPFKLNRAREKSGKVLLRDYHVIDLAKRHRVTPLPNDMRSPYGSDEARRSPRLHFRRGHWRHFANHRTWIKWQLVGNPDLGYIDKHYRL